MDQGQVGWVGIGGDEGDGVDGGQMGGGEVGMGGGNAYAGGNAICRWQCYMQVDVMKSA